MKLPRLRSRLTLVLIVSLGLVAALLIHAENRGRFDQSVAVSRDVLYGEADGYRLLLDVYRPTEGIHPAVLLIHGGAFSSGDKNRFYHAGLADMNVAYRLAESGFTVFNINYRLVQSPAAGQRAGTWTFPAAVEDARLAVRWVRAHAAEYDADPSRIGALGTSAGGNLALMLGTTGTPGEDGVDAVVSWSGPLNFTLEYYGEEEEAADSADNEPPRTTRNGDLLASYVGCSYEACRERWQAASPALQINAETAPTLLINSTNEIMPLAQLADAAERLRQAGVEHQTLVFKGRLHAILYATAATRPSIDFLTRHLAPDRGDGG